MDGSRFDVLTRAFSQGLSRRRIVHVLVTVITGDALGLVEGEPPPAPASASLTPVTATTTAPPAAMRFAKPPPAGDRRAGNARKAAIAPPVAATEEAKCRACDAGQVACGGRCDLGCPGSTSPVNCLCCFAENCSRRAPAHSVRRVLRRQPLHGCTHGWEPVTKNQDCCSTFAQTVASAPAPTPELGASATRNAALELWRRRAVRFLSRELAVPR